MLQFPQKNAPAICRFFEFNLALKPLDGCREQVGIVLKEGNVVLVEIARLSRVHFKKRPRGARSPWITTFTRFRLGALSAVPGVRSDLLFLCQVRSPACSR